MSVDEGQTFALPVAQYQALDWARPLMEGIDDAIRAEALSAFIPAFQERYLQILKSPRPQWEARIGAGDHLLRAMQRDGYALATLEPAHRDRLRELALPLAQHIHARLDRLGKLRFSDGQLVLDPSEHAPIYAAAEAALRDSHVVEAFSAYAGRPIGLLRLAVQVNSARETRMKYGEVDASGLPAHRTSYFHVDSNDWPSVKALIYLNEVELDQGPFRYVVGSHRRMELFEAAVRKTNDKLRQRPQMLLALPREFGQHANFGDFIDETTPGAAELLAAERAVCDGRSDLVLFDNNGVHRGGLVRQGHRYILQCQFWHETKIARLRQMGALSADAETA